MSTTLRPKDICIQPTLLGAILSDFLSVLDSFCTVQIPVDLLRHIPDEDRSWEVSILGVWWWPDDCFWLQIWAIFEGHGRHVHDVRVPQAFLFLSL